MRWLTALVTLTACDLYFQRTPGPSPAPDAPSQPSLFAAPVTYGADAPMAIAVGDIDGDGRPDLVIAGSSLDVLYNLGGGTFGSAVATSAACLSAVALSDFDGDGTLDVATADQCNNTVLAWTDSGDAMVAGATASPVGSFPWTLATGDFNGDGRADVAVATDFGNVPTGSGVNVLLAGAGGELAPAAWYSGEGLDGIAVGDVNGDGAPDLVTATSQDAGQDGTVNVLLGRGDGTFGSATSFPVGPAPEAVALGDLNGDGVLDAVTADPFAPGISVVLGRGDGTFGSAAGYGPERASDVALADVDGDGDLDIIAAQNDGTFTILFNDGTAAFPTSETYACGGCGRLAVQDVNGDGQPDVIGIGVSVVEIGVTPATGVSVVLHSPPHSAATSTVTPANALATRVDVTSPASAPASSTNQLLGW